jgi:nitrogenase subunit NifH
MIRLYTDEEAEEDIYSGMAGIPCSKKSKQSMNGIGCAGYALADECPDDPTKGYWDCLPN